MRKIALLSIKPEFANKILFGVKKFEYRKKPFSKDTTHIVLYMTIPVQRIVGMATVKEIISAPSSILWEMTKKESGITREFYRDYFKGVHTAYAIELNQVTPFNHWINPQDIIKNFKPPQSFAYMHNDLLNKILNLQESFQKTRKNLIFFAGIHGVGKSTFCNKLKKDIGLNNFSTSELIKQGEGNIYIQKEVKNIQTNQDILLEALKTLSEENLFLLDGHFCLLKPNQKIEKIPVDIFQKINPKEIILLETSAEQIVKRLFSRDKIHYKISIIKSLLVQEREHALHISKTLHIPLRVITSKEYPLILKYLMRLLLEKTL